MQNIMTTINDQPQHLLARYADRTGAKFKIETTKGWILPKHHKKDALYWRKIGFPIRLVFSDYGLPSHLPPYKDNPRLPGDGYRVPTGEDSRDRPHGVFADGSWHQQNAAKGVFEGMTADFRLPASVLPPDWKEMTRKNAPTVTSNHTSQPQDAAKAIQTLTARVQELEAQAAASTPTLRPIAEMPEDVPEGCVRVHGCRTHDGWYFGEQRHHPHTHFLDIRLPAPDEELRREWEKLFSHSDALKQIRKSLTEEQVSISFQAFKAGRAKEGAR